MISIKNKIIFPAFTIILILLILCLTEWALQINLPLIKKRYVYMKTRNVFQYHRENIEFDPMLGYRNKANLHTSFSNLEFSTQIETNSQGFRDNEDAFSTADLWLVGDSFSFGWGVEKENLIDTLVEKKCGIKIANMSVSGYGTLQEYLLIKNQLLQTNKKPRWIIFLFYRGNDLVENLGHGLEIYPLLNSNKETITSPKKENFDRWIKMCLTQFYPSFYGKYYILYYLRFCLDLILGKISLSSAPSEDLTEKSVQAFDKTLILIQKLFQNYHIPILFIYIPSVSTYEGENDNKMHNVIHTIFNHHGFYQIDLEPILRRSDYFTLDDHWNPEGHQKAANEVIKFLKRKKLCPV